MLTIQLNQLRFFAYHGLYAEERITGSEYIVELEVVFQPLSGTITGLGDTINYVQLYSIMESEMKNPRDLLETVAMETVERIHQAFPVIKRVSITISKCHPPMARFDGSVGVNYTREFA